MGFVLRHVRGYGLDNVKSANDRIDDLRIDWQSFHKALEDSALVSPQEFVQWLEVEDGSVTALLEQEARGLPLLRRHLTRELDRMKSKLRRWEGHWSLADHIIWSAKDPQYLVLTPPHLPVHHKEAEPVKEEAGLKSYMWGKLEDSSYLVWDGPGGPWRAGVTDELLDPLPRRFKRADSALAMPTVAWQLLMSERTPLTPAERKILEDDWRPMLSAPIITLAFWANFFLDDKYIFRLFPMEYGWVTEA